MSSHYGFIASLLAIMGILLFAPVVFKAERKLHDWLEACSVLGVLALALSIGRGEFAYGLLGLVSLRHALTVRLIAPTAVLYLLASAVLLGATAAALWLQAPGWAFSFSCCAFATRAGLAPLHAGVVELCTVNRNAFIQHNSSLLALVMLHLYHIDHFEIAYALAPWLVLSGTVIALLYALTALVQKELGGLFRTSTLMHAGMLLAAIGAGGRGHFGAALLVAVTLVLAVGGLGLMTTAIENRQGPISLLGPGIGRARAFPRLAAAFAFFAAAGVGMPGTAGFIADDLLLHALWQESAVATVIIIFASAILAVASLNILAKGFFGPPLQTRVPDLLARERGAVLVMVILLLVLGLFPQVLVSTAEIALG